MTDNRNRTASEVRHYFDKYGGNMGATGCVSWSFDKKGVIVINDEDQELDEDKVMEDALEAGAADFAPDEAFTRSIPIQTMWHRWPRRSRMTAMSC